jgi:antitoxin component YwqK of YwqJK toxin-antitoxin module
MPRSALLPCLLITALHGMAQPDTLFIPSGDSLYAYAVRYEPMQQAEQFKRKGFFAHDPERLAVLMDYKRGKPSGVYRAYYPDGKPLIFAVYGWGNLHGDWTEYDEFGRVAIKGQYRNGVRDGTWAFRNQGIVGHYKDGLKHGKWKYYEQGRLVRIEKYHKGQLAQGGTFRFPDR